MFYFDHPDLDVLKLPRLIWWTPFTLQESLKIINCGQYKCTTTDNRNYFNASSKKVIYKRIHEIAY